MMVEKRSPFTTDHQEETIIISCGSIRKIRRDKFLPAIKVPQSRSMPAQPGAPGTINPPASFIISQRTTVFPTGFIPDNKTAARFKFLRAATTVSYRFAIGIRLAETNAITIYQIPMIQISFLAADLAGAFPDGMREPVALVTFHHGRALRMENGPLA